MSRIGGEGGDEQSTVVPDFSHEALAHLQVQSDTFELHVKNYLNSAIDSNRDVLKEDLQRFRNTLVLLDKAAAVYVAEELLQLLDADADGTIENRTELARVLLNAADELSGHVAKLQQDSSLDNALSMLPLVNDSRACREEELLSDNLVLAAGIKLPEPLYASVSDEHWQEQRIEWVDFASEQHSKLAKKLLDWWKTNNLEKALEVPPQLHLFVEFCKSREYLGVLVPLFQSASIVADAIAKQEVVDGPALRKLFAQLERHVHRCILVAAPDDLLPGDLLRNFLYYVGQVDSNAQSAVELRRRFRLDRVRQVGTFADNQSTPTIGVGYHLASAIRSSISTETQALKEWLDQAPTRADHPKVVRLRVRLTQLEPVLTLMGATDALECLKSINKGLTDLDGESTPDVEARLSLAESLLLLDALLDKAARQSITRQPVTSASSVTAEEVFVDIATDACLREARQGLQKIAESLETIIRSGSLAPGQSHLITQQLQLIDNALQILPLPEVSPLLLGLGDVLTRLQLSTRQGNNTVDVYDSVQEDIATLLVSVDYYLGCVLQPQAAASQLLLDAEDALVKALAELNGEAANMPVNLSEAEWEQRISVLLPHMDSLGAGIVDFRKDKSEVSFAHITHALTLLADSSRDQSGSPINELANAAVLWCKNKTGHVEDIDASELQLLDEIHAVVPQLFDQMLSGSDNVRDFDDLMERLLSIEDSASTLTDEDARELTLNVDDKLLSSTLDDSEVTGFDQTLQHVFYHECLSHLESLDESVRTALESESESLQKLPSEQMLRALHTLTGSAQTVDAPHIVAIVQPLQRAALARQRLGNFFDADETRFIGDLVVALRARLESLNSGEPVGQSVLTIEQKLGSFLSASIPGSDSVDSGLGIAANVRSLDDVFGEEAGELLDRLRATVNSAQYDVGDTQNALALLHTLKGSARMAGRAAIAEHAHALESELQSIDSVQGQSEALREGFGTLRDLITQSDVKQFVAQAQAKSVITDTANTSTDSLSVSDTAFDALLDLATDVTVNQARLSDELARMREVYQDIETTVVRFKALPSSVSLRSNPEVNEILADLEAARGVMRGALRQAEREQQQASRASASLQQSLIRTRLVRVDELFDRLSQTVEDSAQSTGRVARLRMEGGEITLDRSLFRQLLAPLQHLARNAVFHGIESAEERLSLGKASCGDILLSASVDGTDLVLRFSDDGRGIKRDDMSEVLRQRGESSLESHVDLQSLLFQSGFSTVATPTELAGHGLGLAAVKSAIEYLGGRIQLATEPGAGTRLTLRIPQRIVVNQVVLVENEGVLFALPVNFVDAVRVAAGASSSIPERYKRSSLSALMSQRAITARRDAKQQRSAVLVTAAGVSMALEIDQVIGYRELVTQALGPQLASLKRYSGGSVLSDGRQVLILDLHQILENQDSIPAVGIKPARESLRPVALIVDDSLTMRVAAEGVLQQCGIAARLARDGVEALESMETALPNLILLDLEMPRLDGKAFLKRITEEYGDACPPVIIISSRDNRENRQQLKSMGAVRFLAKPYTQSQLQEAVEAAGLRLPDITIA